MAESSVLVIEEQKGPNFRTGRLVQLIGPGLPFQGAKWGGEQRVVTTWNAGNGDDATQQVLGPIEIPSDWTGEWNTTRMVGTPSTFQDFENGGGEQKVTRASTLMNVLEDMFRQGWLLRVLWQQGDRKIVRYGRAQHWEFEVTRMDDIRWSITFQWKRRGGPRQRATVLRSEKTAEGMQALTNLAGEIIAAVDLEQIKSVDRSLVGSANVFSLGDLEALLDAPVAFVDQFRRLAVQITSRFNAIAEFAFKAAGLPDALAGQILDAATNTSATLAQVIDEASRLPAELQASRDARVIALLRAAQYFNGVQDRAERGVDLALDLEQRARARLAAAAATAAKEKATPADIIEVHVAKEGETFLSLSIHYYGTPDNGPAIAKANGFPGYQIAPPPGYPLIIPNATAVALIST